ncbi:hypothetical protein B0H66DRAFT_529642 [Apodospora peruviana]|uniref:Indoleamine 2,3-dioxygenase n=1 Tax=Apodospora peruviana TaxID=516989 RepID=A0AAE0IIB6_9PEZI|nr:hypothetical protein B0H66DRAFT_529642 [Apodospora peruviana]
MIILGLFPSCILTLPTLYSSSNKIEIFYPLKQTWAPPEETYPDFHVLDDPKPDDVSLPAFMVSTTRGFLPRMNPIVTLPDDFGPVESILQRMPVKTSSGEPGLLARGVLGETVLSELPDLTDCVDKYQHNLLLMNALYRDYSFLASANLLEPCHDRFAGVAGEHRQAYCEVCPVVGLPPIMTPFPTTILSTISTTSSYNQPSVKDANSNPSWNTPAPYALFNYKLADPSKGLEYPNLRLIRAFEHGLDPSSSEAGFVLVHVEMVKNSGPLVAGTIGCLDACTTTTSRDRDLLNTNLRTVLSALTNINKAMETMWQKSKPGAYTSFRTFIFGITAQSMFPNGVIYQGIGTEEKSFRGESGAKDTMIPLMDNLLQISMPDTPLTRIPEDFRAYRPSNHRQFLEYLNEDDSLKESRGLWLLILNQVRDFRWRHWCFAREYILKRTSHPTATGGSPIVTWLPNQLQAVMDEMVNLYEQMEADLGEECRDIMDLVGRQKKTLRKEVSKFCEERGAGAVNS